ncbi:hypothetical protein [Aeromonas sp. s5]|uniref:hypothetical protein n=1 Tax=Aeromonas sp. s5 TaxID=3138487 RepID=UPI0034A136B3
MEPNQVHGQHTAIISGQIIKSKLIGAFNTEGCSHWVSSVKALIERLEGKPFCLLIDTRDYKGGTDEALAIANDFNGWLNNQRLVAKAHVITSQVLHNIAMQRVPQLKHQHVQTFKNTEDAMTWLTEQLEQANK